MENRETQELVFRADTSGLDKANAAVKQQAQEMDKAADKAEEYSAATQRLDTAMGGVKTSSASSMRAVTELTRGFQDFSAAGLQGISNNVEGLTTSLGKLFEGGIANGLKTLASSMLGPAGILAGLTALTVVGPMAMRAIQDFLGTLDPDPVQEMEQFLEGLRKKTTETADSFDQLKEKSKAAFQTDVEQESGKRVADFLRNTEAARKARANLIEQETNQRLSESAEVQKILGQMGELQTRLRAINERAMVEGPRGMEQRQKERERVQAALELLQKGGKGEDGKEVRGLESYRVEAQKAAVTTVDQRLTAPTALDQETLANQFQGLGMADVAAGIRERGPDVVRRERDQQAVADALEKLRRGAERAVADQQRRLDRQRQAQEQAQREQERRDREDEAAWVEESKRPEQTGKEAAKRLAELRARQRREAQDQLPSQLEIQAGQVQGARPAEQAAKLAELLERTGKDRDEARKMAAEQIVAAEQDLASRLQAELRTGASLAEARQRVTLEIRQAAAQLNRQQEAARQLVQTVAASLEPPRAEPEPPAEPPRREPPRQPARGFRSLPPEPTDAEPAPEPAPVAPAIAAEAAPAPVPEQPEPLPVDRLPPRRPAVQAPPMPSREPAPQAEAPPVPMWPQPRPVLPSMAPIVAGAGQDARTGFDYASQLAHLFTQQLQTSRSQQQNEAQMLGALQVLAREVDAQRQNQRAMQSGLGSFHRTNQLRGR